MKEKILEYIKQLEKSYEHYENLKHQPLNFSTCMFDYYQGRLDSIRATINDLNDILENRTYCRRLAEILRKEENGNE